MNAVDSAMMCSQCNPSEWNEDVLWPIPGHPVSIFGYQQVAMDREKSISLLEDLEWTGLCESKGDARKAIKNNGIMVNQKRIQDINLVLTKADALPNLDAIVLEFGKYNFGIIELC